MLREIRIQLMLTIQQNVGTSFRNVAYFGLKLSLKQTKISFSDY